MHRHVRGITELAYHGQADGPAQDGVPVLQRVKRVSGQYVPRQFALMWERRTAVYARITPLPFINSPPTGPIVLLQPQKRTSTSFFLFHLTRTKLCAISLPLLSKLRCSLGIFLISTI